MHVFDGKKTEFLFSFNSLFSGIAIERQTFDWRSQFQNKIGKLCCLSCVSRCKHNWCQKSGCGAQLENQFNQQSLCAQYIINSHQRDLTKSWIHTRLQSIGVQSGRSGLKNSIVESSVSSDGHRGPLLFSSPEMIPAFLTKRLSETPTRDICQRTEGRKTAQQEICFHSWEIHTLPGTSNIYQAYDWKGKHTGGWEPPAISFTKDWSFYFPHPTLWDGMDVPVFHQKSLCLKWARRVNTYYRLYILNLLPAIQQSIDRRW